MTKHTLTKSDLVHFCGSEILYPHSLAGDVFYTQGVRHVAKQGGAYWLVDEIAFAQLRPEVKAESFQVWNLVLNKYRWAILSCENGNKRQVYSKVINCTDFPLDQIRFYFTNKVLLLPSEY